MVLIVFENHNSRPEARVLPYVANILCLGPWSLVSLFKVQLTKEIAYNIHTEDCQMR